MQFGINYGGPLVRDRVGEGETGRASEENRLKFDIPFPFYCPQLQLATSSTSLCWGYSFSYVDGAETEKGTDRLADGQQYSGTHDSSVGIGNSWHWAFNASARFQFNLHKAGKWAGRAEGGRGNGVCRVAGGRERQGSLSVGACRNLSRRT